MPRTSRSSPSATGSAPSMARRSGSSPSAWARPNALRKLGGVQRLSGGEGAGAVGATSVLRPDDYAISAYREHGHCLAKGSDPRRMMAELFGRRDGLSKGKGGSMHLFDKSKNFLGGHAIVGARLPLAAGAAFAIK